jgi:drug/metabolite transporter (DMT)-like permease
MGLIIMLKYSWIVFVHAILLSFESIVAEYFQNSLEISVITLASIGLPISGGILLLIHFTSNRNDNNIINTNNSKHNIINIFNTSKHNIINIFNTSKQLFPPAIFLSIGIFTWYDSASRIGASKDGLIAGALEIIIVLFLAHLVLNERLTKTQLFGVFLAIIGFFLTISIGNNVGSSFNYFSLGDFESIVSAICFACSYLFTVKLVKNESPIKITGFLLFLSGLFFIVISSVISMVTKDSIFSFEGLNMEKLCILVLFSFIPLSSALFYNIGMKKLGASITSILGSSTIILTIIFQVLLSLMGYAMILPLNISMAILGGSIGIIGIFIIHLPSDKLFVTLKSKFNNKLSIKKQELEMNNKIL